MARTILKYSTISDEKKLSLGMGFRNGWRSSINITSTFSSRWETY
jgi:hypothetical protein